ncbi:MAG: hypothetical protein AAF850_03815 [Pseudomonadota bacterium]
MPSRLARRLTSSGPLLTIQKFAYALAISAAGTLWFGYVLRSWLDKQSQNRRRAVYASVSIAYFIVSWTLFSFASV